MIVDVKVRLATMADADEIAAMSRDYIEHGLRWSWRYKRIARAINDPETNVVVVGPQGTLAAFGIMSYSENDAHLLLLAVRPAARKRGIGSAILTWLEAVARAAGAQRIQVEARADNLEARNFYCIHGYNECCIETARYSSVIDGVRLEKWLRSAG